LLAVSIFTEDLSANESLAVLGTEIYSSLTYSEISPGNHALRFSGEYFDNIHRVKNGTPARTMIFVRSHGAKGIDSEFLDSFKSDVGILFSSIYSAVPKNMNHAAGGIRIDISVGPLTEPAGQSNSSSISSLQEIRFLKLLIASSSAGSNRINYHRLNTLELDLNTQNSTINSIEDFMNFLAKKNVGTSALIKAYSSLMADITRDKNNSYGEYDLRKISAFEEIKKRI
jgi:hypothetical protein